jgi:hypothetical protein
MPNNKYCRFYFPHIAHRWCQSTPLRGRQSAALPLAVLVVLALLLPHAPRAAAQGTAPSQDASAPHTLAPKSNADSVAPSAPASAETSPEDPRRIASKVVRYAQRLVRTYDRNGNGQLEQPEWQTMHGAPAQADLNHDGTITTEELARYVADYGRRRRIRLLPQPGDLVDLPPLLNPTTAEAAAGAKTPPKEAPAAGPAAAEEPPATASTPKQPRRRDTKFYVPPERLPSGLPDWFLARDRDGDGQLTISEYSPKNLPAELQQFQQLDRDGDGVLTAAECTRPAAATPKKPAK